MKFINITFPLYDDMPTCYGHRAFKGHPLFPQAFKKEMTAGTRPGTEFYVYSMFCEPGTRFIMPSTWSEFRPKEKYRLHNIPLNKIIMRDTCIVDLSLKECEIIENAKLEAAFKKAPIKKGDAILIRTGWGDNERYFKMGHDYANKSPHFSTASAEKLMDLLAQYGNDMWLYDTSDMSGEVTHADGTKAVEGFTIRAGMMAVGGVVNCGSISKQRIKLIIQPLPIKDCHMGPCCVVAVEE